MSIQSFLAPITGQTAVIDLPDAENWMQGRTLYGGASALIAYTHAIRAFTDLPPLRAAQVGFVAPVGGRVELRAEIVRQGRSVKQLRSELYQDGALALTAFFLFAQPREPNALYPTMKPSDFPPPAEESEDVMSDKGPSFLRNNFEIRRAQDVSGPGEPVVRRWARLKHREELDPISELILLGDVLPPGAMRAMQRQGPISSINWSFNLLETDPQTEDGWWVSENASQHADNGYSSERLRLWNSAGQQVIDGLQSVAIFG
ncbi:thioesterase family protein [Altererythrobacter ishigakiensis]|uniref:Acyl-CoA thioesterase n=1 Tax=Altererythrobacter ishigakiensis TaxID=476157 RepID=A0A562UUA7_9SPHN|nr:thioesterase family protein [Altererythrobacter ishigakiensis]TWJ09199.1 acyl-CoA thioesterase [Altererythrobacter ishigakiensis]